MEPNMPSVGFPPLPAEFRSEDRSQGPGGRDPVSSFAVDALRGSLKAYLKAAESFTTSSEANVEESIHDARVALRRMRTCIALFAPSRRFPRGIGKTLKTAFKGLEGARDLDITLGHARAYRDRRPLKRSEGLSAYIDHCMRRRDSALRTVRRVCGPAGVSAVRDAIRQAEESLRSKLRSQRPAELDVPVILTREYRRLLDRGSPISAETASVSDYHAARRACKRFRYALEFLRGALGLPAERLIADLRALQDSLGNLNDLFLCQRGIRLFIERGEDGSSSAPDPGSNPELTRYLASLQAELRRKCAGIPRQWGRITSRAFRSWLFASFLNPDGGI